MGKILNEEVMPAREIQWTQAKRPPTSKQRDPIQGEFFNTDSIITLAAKLTREGIGQNPMDAAVDSPVVVRVFVSGDLGAVSKNAAATYFGGLKPHVAACDPAAAQLFEGKCRFLVIEDFNTKGLLGNEEATEEPPRGTENHFFYFFRAEGKSGKAGAERGRWGVGKYVFPMASHVNTFFGLTVRNEGPSKGPLLMGQAVLKNHHTAGQAYEPDGWWSDFNSAGVPIPISDATTIREFCDTWRVARKDQPGLSIIIPYVREDLSAADLRRAILLDYYLAVLNRKFVARIGSPSFASDIVISESTLEAEVRSLPDGTERDELTKQIEVSRWRLSLREGDIVKVRQITSGAPKWDAGLIDDAERQQIRSALDTGGRIVVRVPVNVRRKNETADMWSYFDVLLVAEAGHHGKPQFVREGLFVPEVTSPRVSSIRSMVVIDHPELAKMVGDAEGPAHANWSAQTEKFSGKYRHGQQWLTLIKRAPAEILRIARGDDERADRTIMTTFFPVPSLSGRAAQASAPGVRGPGPTPPLPQPIPSRPRRIRINRIEGGFSIHLTDEGKGYVETIRVRTAYDRRRGNPFTNWVPADFDLGSDDFDLEVLGAEIEQRAGNKLWLKIVDPDAFTARIRGFDMRRDLRIDAKSEGAQV